MSKKVDSMAKTVMGIIRNMDVGESVHFPIERMDTVRVQTSKANAILGGKRVTRLETGERLIFVERIS